MIKYLGQLLDYPCGCPWTGDASVVLAAIETSVHEYRDLGKVHLGPPSFSIACLGAKWCLQATRYPERTFQSSATQYLTPPSDARGYSVTAIGDSCLLCLSELDLDIVQSPTRQPLFPDEEGCFLSFFVLHLFLRRHSALCS